MLFTILIASLNVFLSTQDMLNRKTLLWSDEFDYLGKPRSQNWNYDIGGKSLLKFSLLLGKFKFIYVIHIGSGWGNNELQYYTDSNSQVFNGHLSIVAKKEDKNDKKYASSRLVSTRKFRYGIIEMVSTLQSIV